MTFSWILYIRVTICVLHDHHLRRNSFNLLSLLLYLPVKQSHFELTRWSRLALRSSVLHLWRADVVVFRHSRGVVRTHIEVWWCRRTRQMWAYIRGFKFRRFWFLLWVVIVRAAPFLKESFSSSYYSLIEVYSIRDTPTFVTALKCFAYWKTKRGEMLNFFLILEELKVRFSS